MMTLPVAGVSLWQLAGWTMIHFLWIGAAVAVVGAVLRLVVNRAAPSVRYAASLSTLAVLAFAPVGIACWVASQPATWATLSESGRRLSERVDHVAPRVGQASAPMPLAPRVIDLKDTPLVVASPTPQRVPAVERSEPPVAVPPTVSPSLRAGGSAALRPQPPGVEKPSTDAVDALVAYLPWAWLVGAPATFVWLALGLTGAKRLRAGSTPLTGGPLVAAAERLRIALGVTQHVAVAVSDRVVAPVLVGIVRPLILLPVAAVTGWSPEELELALIHELAHVRRWDNAVNLGQRVIESLLFFHPAVWLASRQVRRDREECCDAIVVALTGRPVEYADLLVTLAMQLRSEPGRPRPRLTTVSAMAHHPLAGRIRRILNLEREPMQVSKSTIGLVAAALLAAITAIATLPLTDTRAEAKDNNPPPSKGREQPSTVAGGDRTQGGSSRKANTEKEETAKDAEKAKEERIVIIYEIADIKAIDLSTWLRTIDQPGVEHHWFEKNGSLILTAPRRVHDQVAELLEAIRKKSEGLRQSAERLTQIDKELAAAEMEKEEAIRRANDPESLTKAVADALNQDRQLQQYQRNLYVLDQEIVARQAIEKRKSSPMIERLQQQKAALLATEKEFRTRRMAELRDELARMPNVTFQAAMAEYKAKVDALLREKDRLRRNGGKVAADDWPRGVTFPSPHVGEISMRAWKILKLKCVPATAEDREASQDHFPKAAVRVDGGDVPTSWPTPCLLQEVDGTTIESFESLDQVLTRLSLGKKNWCTVALTLLGENPDGRDVEYVHALKPGAALPDLARSAEGSSRRTKELRMLAEDAEEAEREMVFSAPRSADESEAEVLAADIRSQGFNCRVERLATPEKGKPQFVLRATVPDDANLIPVWETRVNNGYMRRTVRLVPAAGRDLGAAGSQAEPQPVQQPVPAYDPTQYAAPGQALPQNIVIDPHEKYSVNPGRAAPWVQPPAPATPWQTAPNAGWNGYAASPAATPVSADEARLEAAIVDLDRQLLASRLELARESAKLESQSSATAFVENATRIDREVQRVDRIVNHHEQLIDSLQTQLTNEGDSRVQTEKLAVLKARYDALRKELDMKTAEAAKRAEDEFATVTNMRRRELDEQYQRVQQILKEELAAKKEELAKVRAERAESYPRLLRPATAAPTPATNSPSSSTPSPPSPAVGGVGNDAPPPPTRTHLPSAVPTWNPGAAPSAAEPTTKAPALNAAPYVDGDSPLRLRKFDVVNIQIANVDPDQPIDDNYVLDGQGRVALGPTYGRIKVAGLLVEEAEKKICEHLRSTWKDPVAQVTIAEKHDPTSVPPELRYDGQTFDEWRSKWRYELKTEKRIEAIEALAAFGRAGQGREAAEAILDVAGEYDFRDLLDLPRGFHDDSALMRLKQRIVAVLATDPNADLPAEDWFPALMERYRREPQRWEAFARFVIPGIHSDDESIQNVLLAMARDDASPLQMSAVGALANSGSEKHAPAVRELLDAMLQGNDADKADFALTRLEAGGTRINEGGPNGRPGHRVLTLREPQRLLLALDSPSAGIQGRARRIAATLATPQKQQIVAQLRERLAAAKGEEEQLAAIRALAAIGDMQLVGDDEQAAKQYTELTVSVFKAGNEKVQVAVAARIAKAHSELPDEVRAELEGADDPVAAATSFLVEEKESKFHGRPIAEVKPLVQAELDGLFAPGKQGAAAAQPGSGFF